MAARRLHLLVYATIANCCLCIIVCGLALGTNKWFSATSGEKGDEGGTIKVSYGLFSGTKTKISANGQNNAEFGLKIVCEGAKGCMFSCGTTAENRKTDIVNLLAGIEEADYKLCKTSTAGSKSASVHGNETTINQNQNPETEITNVYINFGLFLSTVAFIGLGIIFAAIAGILALYNTYLTPIQPVLSIFGLYIWNGCAALFIFMGMIMWIIEFSVALNKNAAISDTLKDRGRQDTSGKGSFGVSFWILLLAICLAIANIAILKFRSWKIIKMNEKNLRVMTDKLESGDILLF